MGSNKVFLDTNILLDYVLDRGSYSILAEKIFDLCVRGEIECHIAAHSIVNMFYILRNFYSVSERKLILSSLCKLCFVEAIDERKIREIVCGNQNDIEDHLQMLCAESAEAECIITRDPKGFQHSKIKVMSPREFVG
ncbi:MAG: PIN domain-containing protein [Bacillota bacterium]|nr:PIN domain-containing protein [Bacillota bacterium]